MVRKINIGLVVALLLLTVTFLSFGCTGRQDPISVEQVATVTAEGVLLLPAENEELIISLLDCYNSAKYRRTATSGPSTHRLVLTTSDNAVYTFYMINEEIVEVSLRHGDIRRKFFLESTQLAELIRIIQTGQ